MTAGYLLFALSERIFGAELTGAVEILSWRPSRKVPLSYSYVEGLIDYRGGIYPVFNLRQRLGLGRQGPIGFTAEAPPAERKEQSIILLSEKKHTFGISVDSALKMAVVEVVPAASLRTQGLDVKYIRGVAYEDEREIIILDFERLFLNGG